MMRVFRISLLVGLSAFLIGCGRKPDVPETPDAVAVSVGKAMADNRPEAMFDAMPESYRADINGVVRDAAGRMDADVWNGVVGVMRRIVKVFESKGDLILQTQYLAKSDQKEMLRQNWSRFVSTMTILLDSDFADIDALRTSDVGKMLAGSGGEIMRQLKSLDAAGDAGLEKALSGVNKLETLTAVLVSQDGETATVTVQVEGEEPETMTMVRIEGKWIPRDFADGFAQGIADMRKSIQTIDFTSEKGIQLKKTILSQVSTLNTLLVQAESAESVEQMNGVINGIVIGVMGAAMGSMMGM